MKIPSSTTAIRALYVRSKSEQNPEPTPIISGLEPNLLPGRPRSREIESFYEVLRNTEGAESPAVIFFKSLTPEERGRLSEEELKNITTYLSLELSAYDLSTETKEQTPEILVNDWINFQNLNLQQRLFPQVSSHGNSVS